MAVDIKKMVEKISKLTVLELVRLIEAIKEKFGLRTPDTIKKDFNEVRDVDPGKDPNEVEEADAGEDRSTEIAKADEVSEGTTEAAEASTKSEEESTPVPDPPSIEPSDEPSDESVDESEDAEAETVVKGATEEADEVSDESTGNEEKSNKSKKESKPVPDPSSVPDPGPLARVRKPSPVKRFKGKDFAFVYAWRYSGDKRYAKIGETTKKSFHSRYVRTYHPKDDPILIGIFKCNNKPHAQNVETHILKELTRTRPDVQGHEWVEIDEAFNKMIDDSFISDPNELEKIFGSGIETEKII